MTQKEKNLSELKEALWRKKHLRSVERINYPDGSSGNLNGKIKVILL